jgi:hypothetical protein
MEVIHVTIPDDFVTLSQSSASLAGSVTICEYVLFYTSLAHTIDFFIKLGQYKTNTFDSDGEVILLFFKVMYCEYAKKYVFFTKITLLKNVTNSHSKKSQKTVTVIQL